MRLHMALKRKYTASAFSAPRKVQVSEAVRQYVSKRVAKAGERKHVDASGSGTVGTQATLPFDVYFCGLDAGTGENQRIGERVKLDRMRLKIWLIAADSTNRLRVIVYRKTKCQTTLGTTVDAWADPNLWQILHDQAVTVDLATHQTQVINVDMPLSGIVQFNGNAYTDAVSGQIWMHVVSDSTVTTHPSIYWCSQIAYYDA